MTSIHTYDDDKPDPPKDWIDGSKATYWGRWDQEWPITILKDIQRWGDSNGCRFILVSEFDDQQGMVTSRSADYYLSLYIAPKPNSRQDGLCKYSIANRDNGFKKFGPWLEGFLAGRGLLPLRF